MTIDEISNILGFDCSEIVPVIRYIGTYEDKAEESSVDTYFREMSAQTGYNLLTDYYKQLYNACEDGTIETKYRELLCESETDYKKLTELVLSLNWLDWYYSESHEYCTATEVRKCWQEADEHAFNVLKGEELNYFIGTLD